MDPFHIKDKRILFTVLNWGLGHATRSAKLIKELSEKNEIVIASDGKALEWLKVEFPTLSYKELPELKIKYSKLFGAAGGVIRRLPHFFRSIKKDHEAVGQLFKKENFDLIISDNRYGTYLNEVPSYLISHQLRLINPFSHLIQFSLYNFIEKFDEVWIPDNENRALSGLLSLPESELKVPYSYIGPLSRFEKKEKLKKDIQFLLIASGPEPHRKQLVDYFENNFALLDQECQIVAGDRSRENYKRGKLSFHSTLNSSEIESLINRAEWLICRSGYSSIMDLVKLSQKAVLIPTPGQSEQEYLAKFHSDNPLFICVLNHKKLPQIMKSLL